MADIEFGVKGKNEAIASIGQIESAMKGLGVSTVASTGAMAGGFKALTAAMLANPIGLVVVGFTALTAAMIKCAGAAREDELAQNKLNAALGYTSIALGIQTKALAEQHKMTQGEITDIQQITARYFKTAEAVKTLTPAIIDMATATGQSTEAIAEQLSGAIKSGRGLRQYGIDLKDCNTEQERLNKIAKEANNLFADQAKAVEDTRSPLTNINTQIKELTGNVGGLVLAFQKIPLVTQAFNLIEDTLRGWNDIANLNTNQKIAKDLDDVNKRTVNYTMSVNNLKAGLAELDKTGKSKTSVWKGEYKLELVELDKSGLESELKFYEEKLKPMFNDINAQKAANAAAEIKNNEEKNKTIEEQNKKSADRDKELRAKGDQIFNEGFTEWKKNNIDLKIEEQKRLNETTVSLEYQLLTTIAGLEENESERKINLLEIEMKRELSTIIGTTEEAEKQRDLIITKYRYLREREEEKGLKKKNEDDLKKIQDYMKDVSKLREIAGGDAIGDMSMAIAGFDPKDTKADKSDSKEMKELKKKQRQELKELSNNYKDKLELKKEYELAVTALEKKQAEERKKASFDENVSKTGFALDYADSMVGMIDTIMEATGASAEERKRIAQAEALISGAQGALGVVANTDKYLSSFGPIAGPILMGAQIAGLAIMTGIQVAAIEKAQFAYGGKSESRIVTGGVDGQDSVSATLMPGEIVYNPRFPNPALAQQVANTVPGMSNNNGINIGNIQTTVHINGNVDKSNLSDIEKAMEKAQEKGVLKALKKAQGKGQVYINKSGSLVIHG